MKSNIDFHGQPNNRAFNNSRNREKAIFGLKGILEGVVADQCLTEQELLFLDVWLRSQDVIGRDGDVVDLLDLVSDILHDGVISADDLDMSTSRLGVTLDNRIDVVVESLKSGVEAEFNALSASGFKELVNSLSETVPSVIDRLRYDFEIEEIEKIEPDSLRALGISPLDILYLYTNDEVKKIRDAMGLSKRNNPRSSILESFASANDRLIENYGMLARRDLSGLQSVGIDIRESEIGLKFEEITRTIFEQLGLQVDEDLRKQISTAEDKADIIVSLGGDDVIVGEVKSYKNGDFPKYSSTSRQVKSYVNRCEANGKRVAQALIVAPSFSQDFIDSAEMDADINISLLEADGLKKILVAYKSRRNPKFSEKLLTKGGLLKADLIAKTI